MAGLLKLAILLVTVVPPTWLISAKESTSLANCELCLLVRALVKMMFGMSVIVGCIAFIFVHVPCCLRI